MATKKAKREKRAKEKKRKNVSAKWQGWSFPPDIRRPWEVFQNDVSDRWEDSRGLREELQYAIREEHRAVQKLGALRAFQALPACREQTYTDISLQEVSAFVAWSATCGLADATKRAAVWTRLDADRKFGYVAHNWRAVLAKDPKWHVLISDDEQAKVNVAIRAAPALRGAPCAACDLHRSAQIAPDFPR